MCFPFNDFPRFFIKHRSLVRRIGTWTTRGSIVDRKNKMVTVKWSVDIQWPVSEQQFIKIFPHWTAITNRSILTQSGLFLYCGACYNREGKTRHSMIWCYNFVNNSRLHKYISSVDTNIIDRSTNDSLKLLVGCNYKK